jgi:hypothetical protein
VLLSGSESDCQISRYNHRQKIAHLLVVYLWGISNKFSLVNQAWGFLEVFRK